MNDQSFLPKQDNDDKYNNEDYIKKVLESRDSVEIEKIKKIHNLSDKQVLLFCDFAVLRKEVLNDIKEEISDRIKDNHEPNQEELSMGAYKEQIEPQVRDTVLKLRKKGYNTYESGFSDLDSQRISFSESVLEGFIMPEELKSKLAKDKVELIVKPNCLELKFTEYQDIKTIRDIWLIVEEYIPDLKKIAEDCQLVAAKGFREGLKLEI